jgi:hypothetical protein
VGRMSSVRTLLAQILLAAGLGGLLLLRPARR